MESFVRFVSSGGILERVHLLVMALKWFLASLLAGAVSGQELTLNATYDYVIVGGGTSGLTVANRLSEGGKRTLAEKLHRAYTTPSTTRMPPPDTKLTLNPRRHRPGPRVRLPQQRPLDPPPRRHPHLPRRPLLQHHLAPHRGSQQRHAPRPSRRARRRRQCR